MARLAKASRALVARAPDLDLYRGTTPGWEEGEVARGRTSVHDFGEGLYMTQSKGLAERYAVERAAAVRAEKPGTLGVVYHVPLEGDDLKGTKVFNFYSGENRVKWDAYLDKFAELPSGKEIVERLRAGRGQAELYNSLFEDFVHKQGVKSDSLDVVIGPEYRNGGPQVAIKSKRMRTLVGSRMQQNGPIEQETAHGDFEPVTPKPKATPPPEPKPEPKPKQAAKPPPAEPKPQAEVPPKGERTTGRISVEYDATDPHAPDPIRVKGVNVSDYPPDRPGPITRFFNDRPVTAKLAGVGASAGAAYLSGKLLDLVESHFSDSVGQAFTELDREYPFPDDLLDRFDVPEKQETFDAVMTGLDEWWNLLEVAASAEKLRQLEEDLEAAFGYISRMETVQEYIREFQGQLDPIATDIDKRADVLLATARDLEASFVWFHTHVIGALPFVYYETFTIWSARNVFASLGSQVSALAGTARMRISEYNDLYDALDKRLARASEQLGPWRKLWRDNRKLLKP